MHLIIMLNNNNLIKITLLLIKIIIKMEINPIITSHLFSIIKDNFLIKSKLILLKVTTANIIMRCKEEKWASIPKKDMPQTHLIKTVLLLLSKILNTWNMHKIKNLDPMKKLIYLLTKFMNLIRLASL
jgi:heme/copper-type cytochrome/quinol oxidase subunit 3